MGQNMDLFGFGLRGVTVMVLLSPVALIVLFTFIGLAMCWTVSHCYDWPVFLDSLEILG